MSFITDALALSHVPRWAIVPHTRLQSVADHSFRVAIIADEIRRKAKLDHDKVRPLNLLWGALVHDIDECVTGDIPGPVKSFLRFNRDAPPPVVLPEDRPALTLDEIKLLKVADIIEAATFISQWGVGAHAAQVYDSLSRKVAELLQDKPYKKEAVHIMQEILTDFGRLRE